MNAASGSQSRWQRGLSARAESAPELLRVEEPVALRNSTALAVFALLLLGVANVVWFNSFNFHTIMGDDVYAWVSGSGVSLATSPWAR